MAEKCLIGIDVGTTGVKVLAVAEDGKLVKSAVEAYPLHVPQAGWTEQDPADWWRATIKALEQVIPACARY
ncbi:MAG: FGGY family carbohydrate kinase [Bacillota bacterium]|nr:FGGY family carbohydrate kinase [Bacillota bacterium]